MNRYFFFITFLFISYLPLKSQTVHTLKAPVDSIPDFVKQKVSPELYEILETMSHVYIIDYSFLMDKTFPEKEKDLTEGLQQGIYKLVKEGKITKQNPPEVFAVATTTRVPSLHWKVDFLYQIDEDMQFCKKSTIVYTGKHSTKAQLQAEIWYIYNKNKRRVLPLKIHVSPVNRGTFRQNSLPMLYGKNGKLPGIGQYNNISKSGVLYISFSGLFQYDGLPEGEPEPVKETVRMQLE